MRVSCLSAILLVALIRLTGIIISLYPSHAPDLTVFLVQNNSEAKLAQGKKLKLSEVDLYDLELIPGISDKLGLAILQKRSQILSCPADKQAKKSVCPEHPLVLVHGIALKKARMLEQYLEIK